MPTPCNQDRRFISDNPREQREAAALCFDCPVFELCDELTRGELAGVGAGSLPNDPERKAYRKELRPLVKAKEACINGHPARFLVDVSDVAPSHFPVYGCQICTNIRRVIDRVNDPAREVAA